MNLSPEWVRVFKAAGLEATHWSDVGARDAPDGRLMEWARETGHLLFTHDLDFGAILAVTGALAPSVVQLRCEDTRPATMGDMVAGAVWAHETELGTGAVLTIDPRRMRITILPLKRSQPGPRD